MAGAPEYLPEMQERRRAIDRKIDELERQLGIGQPKEKKEGARGAFGLPSPKDVDALKGKLKELDNYMRALEVKPGDEKLRQNAAKLVDELTAVFQKADLSPAARQMIDTYAKGISAEGGKVDAEAQAIRQRLQQILGAPITIKINPTLSGAPAGKGEGGSTGSGGGAAPKKSSSRAGDVHIKEAHFHGVKDLNALHRHVVAAADRHARAKRDNALHDIEIG
jgi:hypothetical protein